MHNNQAIGATSPVYGDTRDLDSSSLEVTSKVRISTLQNTMENSGGSCSNLYSSRVADMKNENDVVANNIDMFLDEFLVLSGCGDRAGGCDVDYSIDVVGEDLTCLEDPDAFMALDSLSPSDPSSNSVLGMTVVGGLDEGMANISFNPKSSALPASRIFDGNKDVGTQHEETTTTDITPCSFDGTAASEAVASAATARSTDASSAESNNVGSRKEERLRRQKVVRYLEKKRRRNWSRAAPYKSRQRVANERPRHKGRFLPLESEFVPIAELQRRQRAMFKLMQADP